MKPAVAILFMLFFLSVGAVVQGSGVQANIYSEYFDAKTGVLLDFPAAQQIYDEYKYLVFFLKPAERISFEIITRDGREKFSAIIENSELTEITNFELQNPTLRISAPFETIERIRIAKDPFQETLAALNAYEIRWERITQKLPAEPQNIFVAIINTIKSFFAGLFGF